MASDAEIREAQQAIVDRLRCAIRAEAEWVPNTLEVLVRELDALKSPLPSRAEMARRSLAVARCAAIETPAEQHWADALRWVVDASPVRGALSSAVAQRVGAWANELEARE